MKIVQPITITDAALLSTNVPEVLYPNYDAGLSYSIGDRVHVVSTDSHKVYESLTDANINNNPATSTANWAFVSVTNPYLMFDKSVTSQTEYPDEITVEIQTVGRVLALALLNVSAAQVQVTMTDPVEGIVYDETHSLVSTSGIDSWYDYFFEPVSRLQDLTISTLPSHASPVIRVSLTGNNETVMCGTLAIGPTTNTGATQHGATVGIQDFSVKQQDDFGNYSIVERAFRKRATFTVIVPAANVDTLHQLLASLRATPVVYIGSDSYASTAIYGFYKDYTIEIAYPLFSICSIEIEGLT